MKAGRRDFFLVPLKGRLRGYAVGLVQLFREVPHPDLMARCLLDAALADFRESGHHYLMYLVTQRELARRSGAPEEVTALDAQVHEHVIREQIPQRWHLDFLFSRAGYEMYGDPLLAVWATLLIQICTLEQHWERALLGLPPQNPYLLPGFHPDSEVFDTGWLKDAGKTWAADLRALLADAARVLAIVVLPPDPDEELHDVLEAEPESEPAPEAARPASWVH